MDNFLVEIENKLETLSPLERKVADFVLAEPENAMRMPLTKLAQVLDVSQPTVLRFCEKVGCSDLQEFRIRLARANAIGIPATHAAIAPDSPVEDIAARVLDFAISNLHNLRSHLDTEAIGRAVEVLASAHSIHFWGNGASGIVAHDAQQKLPLFGVPCMAETDTHQILINAASLTPQDVAVAISQTGRNAPLLAAVAAARENGATVLALTGAAQTPLAQRATFALTIPTLDNTDIYTPTISRLAALCVIDMLAIAVCQLRGAAHTKKVQHMKETLVRTFRIDPPDTPV